MNSPILKKIISAFIALLLLFYVGNQIYNANYTQVRTETAFDTNASDTAQTTAVAIRKETVITQTTPGVVSYLLSNGSKVANGGNIADLYNTAKDATVQQQIKSIDSEIETLTKLNNPGDTYAVSPDLLDKQIDEKLTSLLSDVHSGEYLSLPTDRADMLYLLNERQVVTKKVTNFSDRIEQLKSQKTALASSVGGKKGVIASPAAGYFISTVDGCESLYNYDKATSLTVSDLKSKQNQKGAVPSNAIGKVCENFDWYFACVLPADTAAKCKVGNSVNITLPFVSTQSIPADIVAVNQTDKKSEAAVIMECSSMDQSLADIRNQTIQIQIEEYSGIRVSQQAIHFANTFTGKNGNTVTVKDAVKGVYVMNGSQIKFVQIVPIFSTGSYVICDEAPADGKIQTESTVKLYDEVVTEGTNLYDGKVVK
ncbi:MAG TPA: HlyD family efflux transporter periplasmic adaptor subunit [Oscillospiraceae bacterium]|nr:HlyD family efflux transporter periplasmic adaptor subunit [Oscillospiraceae bacterium]